MKVFYALAMLLFSGLLAVGLLVYGDYGVSWDGPLQRLVGGANLRYICDHTILCTTDDFLRQFPQLLSFGDKDYGPIHEIIMMTTEWQLGLTDSREVFMMRNLLNFMLFFTGLVAFFLFVTDVLGHPAYGLLAAAIIALSPRFFSHAFFNTKDIAFVAGIMLSLYSMHRFLKSPNNGSLLFHSLASAITIDLRIMGITIVCCTLTALYIQRLKNPAKNDDLKFMMKAYGFFTFLIVTILFPYLWFNPIGNFLGALQAMAHFRWEHTVKFLGEFVLSTELPWYYAPVWIAISTPIAYLVAVLIGTLWSIATILRRQLKLWRDHEEMMAAISLALFLGPLLMVIVLGSVLYDGWRQLYFVYPPAVFLAVLGIKRIFHATNRHWATGVALTVACLAALLQSGHTIATTHPYQQGYLNSLAGPEPKNTFDIDYWGISNKQALERILRTDPSSSIKVAGRHSAPMKTAMKSLTAADRARIRMTGLEAKPNYIITNYRWDEAKDHGWYHDFDKLHEIKSGDNVITTVFKSKPIETAKRQQNP